MFIEIDTIKDLFDISHIRLIYTLFIYLYRKYRCDKKDKNHDINNKISILVSIIRIILEVY